MPYPLCCCPGGSYHVNEVQKFMHWWHDDKERAKCTLEQAIGAYVSSFPGRTYTLLLELLEPKCESTSTPKK
jgi:hypothetical protein